MIWLCADGLDSIAGHKKVSELVSVCFSSLEDATAPFHGHCFCVISLKWFLFLSLWIKNNFQALSVIKWSTLSEHTSRVHGGEMDALFTLSPSLWSGRMCGDGAGCPVCRVGVGQPAGGCGSGLMFLPALSWYHRPALHPWSGTPAFPAPDKYLKTRLRNVISLNVCFISAPSLTYFIHYVIERC